MLRDGDGRVIGGAETFRDLSEVEALRQGLEGKFRVGDLTSRSPLMQRVFEVLPAIAASPNTVIVATNKDLADQMRQGHFRDDLYYRVNVVRVELPPLRRRKEDIPLLVYQIVVRFNWLQQKSVRRITAEALSLLMAHDWPGNIRELENVIERAFILCGDGEIEFAHLPGKLTARGVMAGADADMRSAHNVLDAQAIHAALERNAFNRLAAARELGIHKTTLFRRMKKLNISLPERDGRTRRKKLQ